MRPLEISNNKSIHFRCRDEQADRNEFISIPSKEGSQQHHHLFRIYFNPIKK